MTNILSCLVLGESSELTNGLPIHSQSLSGMRYENISDFFRSYSQSVKSLIHSVGYKVGQTKLKLSFSTQL